MSGFLLEFGKWNAEAKAPPGSRIYRLGFLSIVLTKHKFSDWFAQWRAPLADLVSRSTMRDDPDDPPAS